MNPRKTNKRLFANVDGKLVEIGEVVEELEEFYSDFVKKKKYSEDFKIVEQSFENFKKSSNYQELSDAEKTKLEKDPPEKIIILKFNSVEDAKECLSQMEKKGILKPGAADKLVEQLKQGEASEEQRSFRR